MSDRTIQVALLVVMVCILTVAIISLARVPATSAVWALGVLVGLTSGAVGGILALIARPANNVRDPKNEHFNVK